MTHFCKEGTYTDSQFSNIYLIHVYEGITFAASLQANAGNMHTLHILQSSNEGDWVWQFIGTSFSFEGPEFAIRSFVNLKINETETRLHKIKRELNVDVSH